MANPTRRFGKVETLEAKTLLAADLLAGMPVASMDDASPTDTIQVASQSTADDRPTEEVAFYYNKIAAQYARTSDGQLEPPATNKSQLSATDQALEDTTPVCYLKYKLDRCFVKSWSTSGDADDTGVTGTGYDFGFDLFSSSGGVV